MWQGKSVESDGMSWKSSFKGKMVKRLGEDKIV